MSLVIPDTMWKMEIKDTVNKRAYIAYPIFAVDDSTSKPPIAIGLPGLKYSQNPLLGLEGQTKEITMEFAIWNDGEDRSDIDDINYNAFNVVTVGQQLDYLTDALANESSNNDKVDEYFFDPGFSTSYDIKIYNDDDITRLSQTCLIENVDVPILSSGSWRFITGCRIDLIMGDPI